MVRTGQCACTMSGKAPDVLVFIPRCELFPIPRTRRSIERSSMCLRICSRALPTSTNVLGSRNAFDSAGTAASRALSKRPLISPSLSWVWSCLLSVFYVQALKGQVQPEPSNAPTIRVTSRLVFLDVTVLDKKGHLVVKDLTKDDFAITEEKKPQPISSFEAPAAHVADTNAADDNPAGEAPLTILVLDLLNSRFEDFAYIRYSVRKYLAAQPAQLTCCTLWIMSRLLSLIKRRTGLSGLRGLGNRSMRCKRLHCRTRAYQGERTSYGWGMADPTSIPEGWWVPTWTN